MSTSISEIQRVGISTVEERLRDNVHETVCPKCGKPLSLCEDSYEEHNQAYCIDCNITYYGPLDFVMAILACDENTAIKFFEERMPLEVESIQNYPEEHYKYRTNGHFRRAKNFVPSPEIYNAFLEGAALQMSPNESMCKIFHTPRNADTIADTLIKRFGIENVRRAGMLDEYDQNVFVHHFVRAFYSGENIIYLAASKDPNIRTFDGNEYALTVLNEMILKQSIADQRPVYICSKGTSFLSLLDSGKYAICVSQMSELSESAIEQLKDADVIVVGKISDPVIAMIKNAGYRSLKRLEIGENILQTHESRNYKGSRGGSYVAKLKVPYNKAFPIDADQYLAENLYVGDQDGIYIFNEIEIQL